MPGDDSECRNQKGGPCARRFSRKSTLSSPGGARAPPGPSKLLLLGFLCLLGLLRCLLLRFLSHSILFWVNGWKRDTEACSGRASLATASIIIRTDSLTRFPRCHLRVITLSTAVLHFDAVFAPAMTRWSKIPLVMPSMTKDFTVNAPPGARCVYQFKTTPWIAALRSESVKRCGAMLRLK